MTTPMTMTTTGQPAQVPQTAAQQVQQVVQQEQQQQQQAPLQQAVQQIVQQQAQQHVQSVPQPGEAPILNPISTSSVLPPLANIHPTPAWGILIPVSSPVPLTTPLPLIRLTHTPFIVGRGQNGKPVDAIITDPRISNQHVVFRGDPEKRQYSVAPLSTTNGVYINNVKLTSRAAPTPLAPGDEVGLVIWKRGNSEERQNIVFRFEEGDTDLGPDGHALTNAAISSLATLPTMNASPAAPTTTSSHVLIHFHSTPATPQATPHPGLDPSLATALTTMYGPLAAYIDGMTLFGLNNIRTSSSYALAMSLLLSNLLTATQSTEPWDDLTAKLTPHERDLHAHRVTHEMSLLQTAVKRFTSQTPLTMDAFDRIEYDVAPYIQGTGSATNLAAAAASTVGKSGMNKHTPFPSSPTYIYHDLTRTQPTRMCIAPCLEYLLHRVSSRHASNQWLESHRTLDYLVLSDQPSSQGQTWHIYLAITRADEVASIQQYTRERQQDGINIPIQFHIPTAPQSVVRPTESRRSTDSRQSQPLLWTPTSTSTSTPTPTTPTITPAKPIRTPVQTPQPIETLKSTLTPAGDGTRQLACLFCQASKRRCDNSRPCLNCAKRGRPCLDGIRDPHDRRMKRSRRDTQESTLPDLVSAAEAARPEVDGNPTDESSIAQLVAMGYPQEMASRAWHTTLAEMAHVGTNNMTHSACLARAAQTCTEWVQGGGLRAERNSTDVAVAQARVTQRIHRYKQKRDEDHTGKDTGTTSEDDETPRKRSKSSIPTTYTCSTCQRSYKEQYDLDRHHATTHGMAQPYACNGCRSWFTTAWDRTRHQRMCAHITNAAASTPAPTSTPTTSHMATALASAAAVASASDAAAVLNAALHNNLQTPTQTNNITSTPTTSIAQPNFEQATSATTAQSQVQPSQSSFDMTYHAPASGSLSST